MKRAYYKMKGGLPMTNVNGTGCCNSCGQIPQGGCNATANFSFILVLFILLVICGTAYIF
jgi:uncharacterized protein (TIGR01732 family)